MSTQLAIAGVTAVLQYYLGNVYGNLIATFGGTVTVSAKAPDIIQSEFNAGSALCQVNLFLHQVTHNPGWRNVGLPSLGADGTTQLKNPPLALDLHYLLTAYGSLDWQAEALLGYALLMLHQNPVLSRNEITSAFNGVAQPGPYSTNPLSSLLGASGLADQIELIKITPEALGREEVAWLWTALKADYRPTYPFQASVILIQSAMDVSFALPVRRRLIKAQPIMPAQVLDVSPPKGEAAAATGDTVTIQGENLAGASKVSLVNSRLAVGTTVATSPVDNSSVSFVVPTDSAATPFPAGIYELTVLFLNSTGDVVQSTNSVPFAVAPTITTPAPSVAPAGADKLVTIHCTPRVRLVQSVSLLLNETSVPAQPFVDNADSLSFQFSPPFPANPQFLRLQVDGVPSSLPFDWHAHPPAFTGATITL